MSSKCDLKIKVWCKRKGRHQRLPLLSFFKWFEPPWLPPPLPQNAKIRQKSNFGKVKFWPLANKKSVYENGHISGTVRPTSLQHPSTRSSLLGQPEKHLRRSLGCPGNTGEPEALKNRAKKGLFWFFLPLKLSKTPISRFSLVTQTKTVNLPPSPSL